MERFFCFGKRDFCDSELCSPICEFCDDSGGLEWNQLEIVFESIFGEGYDLSRLRELVQADRDGRCVISPKEGVLKKGDRVWYVDIENGALESGTVFVATCKDGKLDSFSVNFDSGDFDEFLGIAWGDCIFGSKKSAEEALKGEKHG